MYPCRRLHRPNPQESLPHPESEWGVLSTPGWGPALTKVTGLHYPPRVLDLGEVRNIWICGRAPNLWHGHSF